MTFETEAARLAPDLVALRRRLHARPEVGLMLPATQRSVGEALEGTGLEVSRGKDLSSVVGVLRGSRPGPTVLLRGDMDALPVTEDTGLAYASANGAMHACGHDLHTAALVGAARLLDARRDDLAGSIVFMFQPGEEGHDGARMMLAEGVMDAAGSPVDAAYAIHVDCTRPSGHFATRPGAFMASVSGLRIRITGTGGHAAWPHDTVDPVPVAAEAILAMQTFVARRVPVSDPVVLSVVDLRTDSPAGNVLPRSVEIVANVRTLSRRGWEMVQDDLVQMLADLARAHRCDSDVRFQPSYPVTLNHDEETETVLARLRALHGAARVERMAHPAMASEDFSYVLEQVPGMMLFLGARPRDVDPASAPGMHAPTARFDDGVLGLQAATLADLAWERTRGDHDGPRAG